MLSLCMAAAFHLGVIAQNVRALDVQELTLSNGMKVWLNEDHSQPKVFGAVVVNAGAKDCPDTGIAHYFEHIMFKGTDEIGTVDYAAEKPLLDSISACYDQLATTRDEATRQRIQIDINRLNQKAGDYAIPNEFNRLISQYGGTGLNAGTSWDYTYYHNSFTPQYLEQWCILNSDRLINPVFRLFQGELETVYEEKNMYSDDMMNTALEKVLKEMFGNRPYAYPIIGSTENLKNPRLSEMKAFYEKYYVGRNMGLVLCGDFDSDVIIPLLERTFGRIREGVKPTRTLSPLPDITEERTAEIKIPIPIVQAEALIYKAPTQFEPDANAMDLAMSLLYNEKAGMLDSLNNEGVVMQSMAMAESLNDAGICGVVIVPNLFGSTKKAEKVSLSQIRRLCKGDFSDEAFNSVKTEALLSAKKTLETIDNRSMQMVMVMSSGHSWQEYLDKVHAIDRLTKQDVIAAANRYLNAPFVRFKKKTGRYPKDKVSQPGYHPIIPKNKNAESAYAQRLKTVPATDYPPRLLDFDNDVTTTTLGEYCTLYTAENKFNDLFKLTLSYNKGILASPRLEALSNLLDLVGTDSLSRQKFGVSLQQLGATLSFDAGSDNFVIVLTGIDKHFDSTVKLLGHMMNHVQSDKKSMKQLRDMMKTAHKTFDEGNREVLRAMIEKVAYGNASIYLNQLGKKEIKSLTGEELIDEFEDLLTHESVISYSGTLPSGKVASTLKSHLPCDRCTHTFIDYSRDVQQYDEPLVLLYDMPKSRQTLFATYESIKPLPTIEERVPLQLFSDYFGGGMSSILFQEVREFRSMAYSASSFTRSRPRIIAGNTPLAFGTVVGTQSDKSMQAIVLIDSLLHNMPLLENNFESARQHCINSIYTQFPSFRNIGMTIGNQRRLGYTTDSNTGWAEAYNQTTLKDITQFYESNIQHNEQHRVLMIVGNKKKLNMDELSKYGRIVEVQEKDLRNK